MIKNKKQKQKQKHDENLYLCTSKKKKKQLSRAESLTVTICTEGRLLDHYATLQKDNVKWDNYYIQLKVSFPWNSAGRRCLKLVELYLSWIQRYILGGLVIIIICCCCWFPPSFSPEFFFGLFRSNEIFIARHLRHLFVTGFVKIIIIKNPSHYGVCTVATNYHLNVASMRGYLCYFTITLFVDFLAFFTKVGLKMQNVRHQIRC